MEMSELKYKLKGCESFAIREGWLNKGLSAINNNETIFTEKYAMDKLGVGSKMVKSIRYWLLATGLCYETKKGRTKGESQKIKTRLTENFGEIIYKYDKYFEDIFTLWILHYNLVRNQEFSTVWNLFFNKFNAQSFQRIDMANRILDEFNKIYNKDNSLYNAVNDDCNVILKMYSISDEDINIDPEDNLSSPFNELGLIRKNINVKGNYSKVKPVYNKLDKLVILYILLCNIEENEKKQKNITSEDNMIRSVDIDTLLLGENNVGRVLNLDRVMINEYLDQLRQSGYITINRTAGLDMVYIKNSLSSKDVLEKYYKQNDL